MLMNEPNYQFYLIQSKKSQPDAQGHWQVTLACVNEPLIKVFFWFEQKNEPTHIQFFFNEEMIEWREGQALSYGKTNRFQQVSAKQGRQKGSRTFIPSQEASTLSRGRAILQTATAPRPYQNWLRRLLE